jgi:catechol-2,3-dioxygenase
VPHSAVLLANSTTPRFFMQSLGQIAIVVREYDEAIRFYVDALGFELI